MDTKQKPGIKRRGFGSMSPERLKEISAKGGRTSKGGGRKKQEKKPELQS
jgi:general stress protein YciG